MKRAWIRSSLFNILFYSWTGLCCLLFIPFYILPRPIYLGFVRFWLRGVHLLEVLVLNLRYEIRGQENLPSNGPYIVAAKHQSAYETMKIHLLFKDPAIILKQELLKIPFWGPYLKKADVIAIDRSTPDQAIQSIQDGARRVQAQGRPIIIFPQGTRVWPDETTDKKPYKVGVARIQEATNLPIIPLAMNTGMFWPRSGWLKSSGKVVFEYLPPIEPGLERSALLKQLETLTEQKSGELMDEALMVQKKFSVLKIIISLILLCALYTALWFGSAKMLEHLYLNAANATNITRVFTSPVSITGFPGPMVLTSPHETLTWQTGSADIENIRITSWTMPLPLLFIDVEIGKALVDEQSWKGAVIFSNTKLRLSYFIKNLTIHESETFYDDNPLMFEGTIGYLSSPPDIDLLFKLENAQPLIDELKRREILNDNSAIWATAGLEMYRKDDLIQLPVQQKSGSVYLGLIPVMKLDTKNEVVTSPRRQSVRPEPEPLPAQ